MLNVCSTHVLNATVSMVTVLNVSLGNGELTAPNLVPMGVSVVMQNVAHVLAVPLKK